VIRDQSNANRQFPPVNWRSASNFSSTTSFFPRFCLYLEFLPRVNPHCFSYPFLDAPPESDFCPPWLIQQIWLL
jgi:hypothetical protein